LKLPDVTKPFILQTDASHIGIGDILLQEDAAGEKRPVAFASRKLQLRETHYSTIERGCLVIVWGVTKFQEYVYGTEFVLETDPATSEISVWKAHAMGTCFTTIRTLTILSCMSTVSVVTRHPLLHASDIVSITFAIGW